MSFENSKIVVGVILVALGISANVILVPVYVYNPIPPPPDKLALAITILLVDDSVKMDPYQFPSPRSKIICPERFPPVWLST